MFTCCWALLISGCTRLPMRITLQETPWQGDPPGKETPGKETPLAGRPPSKETPWQGDPPGKEIPLQGDPRQGDPPLSMCGRYASYWNVFLFPIKLYIFIQLLTHSYLHQRSHLTLKFKTKQPKYWQLVS